MSGKFRILCVDDEPENNRVFEDILSDEYEVKSVLTGEECLQAVPDFRPHLVLMDVMMPEMDGYELIKKLKETPENRGIKILHVSAYAQMQERLKCYELGTDDFLSRPFNPQELLAKVRVHLRTKTSEEVENIRLDTYQKLSHDVRTALTGIMGSANLLHWSQKLSGEDKDYVKMILESGELLTSIVDKYKLFVELKKGTICRNFKLHNLYSTLEKIVKGLEEKARYKGVGIILEPEPKWLAPVPAVAGLLEIALTYIIENALRYSPSFEEVWIGFYREQEKVVCFVKDQGKGIPQEKEKWVFEALPSYSSKPSDKVQGCSLVIAREIAKLHEGDLCFKSQPGRGTTFYFSLKK